MAEDGVNTMAIAACSHRVMYDAFNFENCIIDRVNLREQVVWSQKPGDEDTQMMAEDYLRMGIAKINAMHLPEPYKPEEEFSKDILVVGGGLTGLTSTLEAAKAGYSVVLVEKEVDLGGFQKNVKEIATTPYKDLKDNDLEELIKEVTENDRIKVYTGATIEKISGGPGVFKAFIRQNGIHKKSFSFLTGYSFILKVYKKKVSVRSSRYQLKSSFSKGFSQNLGICHYLLLVNLELFILSFLKGYSLGCNCMHMRAALIRRKNHEIDFLFDIFIGLTHNNSGAWAS